MEQLPPGQYTVNNWPVLSAGRSNKTSLEEWTLTIDGLVENPVVLTYQQLLELEPTNQKSDFHCVTTWSLLDTDWKGVSWSKLAELVKPKPEAKYVLQHSNDTSNYITGTEYSELLKDKVLVAYEHNGEKIPTEHGGPIRLILPQLYAYKSAKWLTRLEFLPEKELGYWEVRGYSELANPWKEQRYTEDDKN